MARLAIILDDLGYDRAAADAIFALPYPLTLSVLPNQPHSADIAEEAERRGYQVMLHLPMQPVADEKAEPIELRPGLSQSEVASVLDGMSRTTRRSVSVSGLPSAMCRSWMMSQKSPPCARSFNWPYAAPAPRARQLPLATRTRPRCRPFAKLFHDWNRKACA